MDEIAAIVVVTDDELTVVERLGLAEGDDVLILETTHGDVLIVGYKHTRDVERKLLQFLKDEGFTLRLEQRN